MAIAHEREPTVARCRREIARCRKHIKTFGSDRVGASLGLDDWFAELLILKGEWPMQEQIAKANEVIVQPAGSRILVTEDVFRYAGRLIIPDNAKRSGTTGVVVALGPDAPRQLIGPDCYGEPVFKIGDHLIYNNFAGTPCKFDNGPAYRFLSPDEVLGFLPRDFEGKVQAAGTY
jgi:co-chaperonin GroES (HSP10)